ncbi:MAG: hypothetical protein JST52_05795 [Bacteroidetes bacterium]|nr:hypothetical protein [Bacteroidota bacterium]MBS1740014.1 hypothetical protein [Bacteroidota bacterium]
MHNFSEMPDILKTDILSYKFDIFWQSNDELINLDPRPVFVASTAFQPNSPEEEQLIKMLSACRLDASSFHVMQLQPESQIAFHLLKDHLQLKSIILLGISPIQLGVSAYLMPHQLSRFGNCNWIVTESLKTLLERPEIKTHLWQYGLKPAFVDQVYG